MSILLKNTKKRRGKVVEETPEPPAANFVVLEYAAWDGGSGPRESRGGVELARDSGLSTSNLNTARIFPGCDVSGVGGSEVPLAPELRGVWPETGGAMVIDPVHTWNGTHQYARLEWGGEARSVGNTATFVPISLSVNYTNPTLMGYPMVTARPTTAEYICNSGVYGPMTPRTITPVNEYVPAGTNGPMFEYMKEAHFKWLWDGTATTGFAHPGWGAGTITDGPWVNQNTANYGADANVLLRWHGIGAQYGYGRPWFTHYARTRTPGNAQSIEWWRHACSYAMGSVLSTNNEGNIVWWAEGAFFHWLATGWDTGKLQIIDRADDVSQFWYSSDFTYIAQFLQRNFQGGEVRPASRFVFATSTSILIGDSSQDWEVRMEHMLDRAFSTGTAWHDGDNPADVAETDANWLLPGTGYYENSIFLNAYEPKPPGGNHYSLNSFMQPHIADALIMYEHYHGLSTARHNILVDRLEHICHFLLSYPTPGAETPPKWKLDGDGRPGFINWFGGDYSPDLWGATGDLTLHFYTMFQYVAYHKPTARNIAGAALVKQMGKLHTYWNGVKQIKEATVFLDVASGFLLEPET